MAREIIVQVWCDWCQDIDMQTPGDELPPIQVGGQKARVPALCEPHKKEFYDPFVEMLQLAAFADAISNVKSSKPQKVGAVGGVPGSTGTRKPPVSPEAKATGIPCPYEGCDSISKNRSSLGGHTRSQHQISLKMLLRNLGNPPLITMDGRTIEPPGEYAEPADDQKRFDCAIKGCDVFFEWGVNSNRPAHSMSVHYTGKHGITKEQRDRIGDDAVKLNKAAKR